MSFRNFQPRCGHRFCIDELHRDTKFVPGLTQAAFHQVARAEFVARGMDVNRLVRVTQSRTAGDDAQVGEARQARHDVFRESFRQRREVGLVPVYLKGSTATQKPSSARAAPEVVFTEDLAASTAGPAAPCSGEISNPALRRPSRICSTKSGCHHFRHSARAVAAKSGLTARSSRKACCAAFKLSQVPAG